MKYTRTESYGGNEYVINPDGTKRRVVTFYGNSGRTKPTYEEGAREPDRLVETDTGKIFVFDEEIRDWQALAT